MMRIKRFLLFNFVLANLLFAGLISQSAQAAQFRFPATVCQVWGADRNFSEYLSYSQFGRIENQHTGKRIGIVCPVALHNTPSVDNVRVFYRDRNSSNQSNGTLTCRLRSNNIDGTSSNDSEGHSTSLGATATSEWHFDNVNTLSFQHQWVTNNLTLFCLIPPVHNGKTSSIGSIVIDYTNIFP